MIYKHWGEIYNHMGEDGGIPEEHIIRNLIHQLISNISIEELEEIFKVEKNPENFQEFGRYPRINYLVTLEIDLTPEELEIKKELIKQLKNGNFT